MAEQMTREDVEEERDALAERVRQVCEILWDDPEGGDGSPGCATAWREALLRERAEREALVRLVREAPIRDHSDGCKDGHRALLMAGILPPYICACGLSDWLREAAPWREGG